MKGRKKYRIRTGARTASKVKEKELIQKAKKLRKNPDLVLPTCDESCRFCPFDKIRRQLDKISEYSDDEKALEKLSSKGDNIADVSNQLGHFSEAFTLKIYYHWIPGKKKSEVDELDDQEFRNSHRQDDKVKEAI